MANAVDTNEVLSENLRDIGLNDDSIRKCLKLLEEKRYTELKSLLRAYRKTLLDNVHLYCERIDCLDYFTYTIEKNGGM